MRSGLGVLVLCLASLATATAKARYSGHKVIRVTPQTDGQLVILRKLVEITQVDVWQAPSIVHRPVDINVPPSMETDIVKYLRGQGLEPSVMIRDVQALIDQQMQEDQAARIKNKDRADFDFSKYHTLEEITDWMANISASSSMVSLEKVAVSTEGRQMNALVIRSPGGAQNRSGFWIEGGIHAREWISPATVIYIVGQMLEKYESYPGIKELVDSFEWYILPVTNPDGYVYTWDKERLWRKTRSKHELCYGVDPNRNWDYHWGESGASANPCSDTYRGPKAFSEPEVKGVADYLSGKKNVKGFIDFHSYSQLWMSPWGYTTTDPSDFEAQDKGSIEAVTALTKTHGTKYEHGEIARTIYVASGSSADWAYGVPKIEYSYAVELRDTGEHGFLLPADQIIPTGEETLNALVALARYVAAR